MTPEPVDSVALRQFSREYRTVRRAEGWGSRDPAYYRALPYRDLTHRFEQIWRMRARSYETLVDQVLRPLERQSLRIVDLGSGNGWLSYRLAQRGHRVLAVDILDDPLDGLGALRCYADVGPLAAVLAEFDQLPLRSEQFNMVIFNASLHYSTDYTRTLRESLRVLTESGTLVILDSPMYSDPSSGARMVKERETRFQATYGFASNALPSEHFLTPGRLDTLAQQLNLRFLTLWPRLGASSRLSRTVNGIRAGREPARFPVIVGKRA